MSRSLAQSLAEKPFQLILSSGFFGFYAHAGVISALHEAALFPAHIGGSSAGSLVGGMWAAGVPAAQIAERLFTLSRDDFWDLDPSLGLFSRSPGLLRGAAFARLLDETLATAGVTDFAACRIPLRVVAWNAKTRKTEVLSTGNLALAIRASCTFPGLFQPTRIGNTPYLDGGIGDRAGILAAAPNLPVLFHHLPATSPWRRFFAAQNAPPRLPNMVVLTEPRLPRLGPYRMQQGPQAFALAKQMTQRALDRDG
jgi:NTE family protein